jgi:hypothetical protein
VVADLTGGMGWSPSATTLSDADGNFFLCGATALLGAELSASKPGYRPAAVSVGFRSGPIGIELTQE